MIYGTPEDVSIQIELIEQVGIQYLIEDLGPSRETLDQSFVVVDLNVLVIGDVMVDNYLWGKVSRISPEAPVPIVAVQKKERRLGGAANVALNNVRAFAKATTAKRRQRIMLPCQFVVERPNRRLGF